MIFVQFVAHKQWLFFHHQPIHQYDGETDT